MDVFFGVAVEGGHHLWRQRFPSGEPEQITSGLTEEDGVTIAPDGKSLITSIGVRESAVWIHDATGDRPLTSQGYTPPSWTSGWFGVIPIFSKDGKSLYYLRSESPQNGADLWRTEIDSGKNERSSVVFRFWNMTFPAMAKRLCSPPENQVKRRKCGLPLWTVVILRD
jgi:hypothetical protein